MFSCIGVQLFKGSFYHCNDSAKLTEVDCQCVFFFLNLFLSLSLSLSWSIVSIIYLPFFFPYYSGTFYKYEGKELSIAVRKWTNYKFHFDNVFYGMQTLFTIITFEGWPG